jgi:hypothetical protein
MVEAAGEKTMRNFRPFAYLGLFLAFVLLASVFAWILVRFGTPQAQLVYAGEAKDYLPGHEPRLFGAENVYFFVLNFDGELIAVTGRSNHRAGCQVHWVAMRNMFVDPCMGTQFFPQGAYRNGPPGELEQLPVQIRDGQVWVNLGYK